MSFLLEILEKNAFSSLERFFLFSARRAVETERLTLKFWNISLGVGQGNAVFSCFR